jgi:regulator-associated protein of mTOR
MNLSGEEVSLIRYHDGFLGQRIGPVSCLAFHPYVHSKKNILYYAFLTFIVFFCRYQILLAAGATDSIISIYAGETFKSNQP